MWEARFYQALDHTLNSKSLLFAYQTQIMVNIICIYLYYIFVYIFRGAHVYTKVGYTDFCFFFEGNNR